jgi:hypothetical protein
VPIIRTPLWIRRLQAIGKVASLFPYWRSSRMRRLAAGPGRMLGPELQLSSVRFLAADAGWLANAISIPAIIYLPMQGGAPGRSKSRPEAGANTSSSPAKPPFALMADIRSAAASPPHLAASLSWWPRRTAAWDQHQAKDFAR